MSDPLLALASVTPEQLEAPRMCLVGKLYLSLDEARAAALRHLVEESSHSAPRIARACQEAGVSVAISTVSAHRRRDCACPA